MKVTVPFWFYCKLVWSNAEKYPDKLDKLFTLQNIASLLGIGFTLDFGFKIFWDLTKSAPFQLGFTRCISPYTDVALFFFLFFSKNLLSPPPPPTTLRWRSTNPLRFFLFYHAHSTDFEKKIEGLWTGWRVLHLLKNDETNPVSKNKVTNPEKYGALLHDSSLCTDPSLHRLYDKLLTCISKWTPTPDKVFDKLLMSFHIRKKLLGLQCNQIFNQEKFFSGMGGGGVKWFGELCVSLKKSWLRPWQTFCNCHWR